MSAGILANQIAVLSPWAIPNGITSYFFPDCMRRYQAQVTLLSSTLSPEYPELEFGTVDGMQGLEEEAVIISLVRSNEKVRIYLDRR